MSETDFTEKPSKKPKRSNKGSGRPRTGYDEKPEHIQFLIDCFACYYSSWKVFKALQERYKNDEDCQLSLSTVKTHRQKYLPLIIERRKEISQEIPILDPHQRWLYAQELYEMATEGIEAFTTSGLPYDKKDIKAGVAALKLAHEMSGKDQAGDAPSDEEIVRQVVKEAYEDVAKTHPDWSVAEIARYLTDELPVTATPYIDELAETVVG
jgi:hypothetical protein